MGRNCLFEPAVRSGSKGASVPVQGARLAYSSEDAAWTGDASFVPHLYRLFCGGGLEVRAVFQPEAVHGADRRAVAESVRSWMTKALGKQGRDFFLPDLVTVSAIETQISDGFKWSDGFENVHRDVFVQRPVVRV